MIEGDEEVDDFQQIFQSTKAFSGVASPMHTLTSLNIALGHTPSPAAGVGFLNCCKNFKYFNTFASPFTQKQFSRTKKTFRIYLCCHFAELVDA